MKSEKELTGQQSLLIIQQMIHTAKQEQKDDGTGWIIWGWMLFAASVFTVINLHLNWVHTYFFWNIFGALSIVLLIVSVIRNFATKNKAGVKTYTKEVFQKLNIGFTITLLLNIVAINVGAGPTIGFALLTALYGFWILVYGALLNFKPSIIGAYITWALALAAMFAPNFEGVMIIHAAAVLIGYIIPGHIAYKKFRHETGRKSHNQQGNV